MYSRASAKRRGHKKQRQSSAGKQAHTSDTVLSNGNQLNSPDVELRRAALKDAGRQHGNQFVMRLLKGAGGIQRKSDAPAGLKGATLVGLQRGDGLNFGTFDRRPRVAILQQKLNEKMEAGLTADGKFGAKTEQILREFQESMEQPGSHIVDPVTADLLMSESTPDRPGKNMPTEDKNKVKSTGTALNEAAEQLKKVGARHLTAAMKMAQGEGKALNVAGSFFQGGEEMVNSAFLLAEAGKLLNDGSLAQITEAGLKMELSGDSLMRAGQHLKVAAETLASCKNRSYKVAAVGFGPFAAAVFSSGQNIKLSGQQFVRYAPPAVPGKQIGDPLVGLKQGDGITFGTWDRRPRVKELQSLIIINGGGGLKIDGMFGDNTTSGLIIVQIQNGIKPGNQVDLPTAQALRKGSMPDLPKIDPLTRAGKHLEVAGKLLVDAENFLMAGALAIRSGPGPADAEASSRLQKAVPELAETGRELDKAGKSLKKPENVP
jgi:peptidoglycan hydrolase-like protein with peptidoglycan-binding domain